MSARRMDAWLIGLLLALSACVYAPAVRNGFVDFDDDRYITKNVMVRQGLTSESIAYAFQSTKGGNWNPLTWLSLQLDATLFGLNPAGFHAVNVAWHALNTVLLFLVLRSFSASAGRSLAVAALFCVHPLHVESVAWISERKDVISTACLLGAVWAYQAYRRRPALLQYLMVMGLFALGLMAKPMLVTFPLLLLVLDFWPLRRLQFSWQQSDTPRTGVQFWHLCVEKIPLLLMALGVAGITFFTQERDQSMIDFIQHPLAARVSNAVISYAWYLGKTVCPTGLCIFYPLELGKIDLPWLLWSLALMLGITTGAVVQWRERPYLLTGWAWYLIALLPVIGLIQVGGQAHADRYTYVPHLGLLVALVWGGADLLAACRFSTRQMAALTLGVLALCSVLTMRQIATWKNPETLWTHADQTVENNWMAWFYQGRNALIEGNPAQARDSLQRCVDLRPRHAEALALLGNTYLQEQRWADAEVVFERVFELIPWHSQALIGMSAVAYGRGRPGDAESYLLQSLETNPDDDDYARLQLGLLYVEAHEIDAGLEHFEKIYQHDPENQAACRYAAQACVQAKRLEDAILWYQRIVQQFPADRDSHLTLSRLYYRHHDDAQAKRHAAIARELEAGTSSESPIQQASATFVESP
jgi:tetratricopeptide (TPR) repeat protein